MKMLEENNDGLYYDQPLISIQKSNEQEPWMENEVIYIIIQIPFGTREIAERHSRGPSYKEIFKQYIRSGGEHMQMYRVFYCTVRKAPVAITYVKKIKFNDRHYGPQEKFLISDSESELVETFAQSGKSIIRMQEEAKRICMFLSRAYGFRIEELIADFVRDKSDAYWLTNVKSFTLEPTNYNLKKLEYEKLIQNQAAILITLREQASDSSII